MVKNILNKIFAIVNTLKDPFHLRVTVRDLFRRHERILSDEVHLNAAMEWLCRAQSVTGCGGVSGGYYFSRGWMPVYPETTGYIIPTFLKYGRIMNDMEYIERSKTMGDWEIEIQLPSGAVRGGMGVNEYPTVFNTGQVILGWLALYKELKNDRYLNASIKAADWLLQVQDEDGKWSRYTHKGVTHAYNTKVAWPLFELHEYTGDIRYKTAAGKNILWTLSCAKENGWFDYMGFAGHERPFTHTIAYTLQGLLESVPYLPAATAEKTLLIVQKACKNIISKHIFSEKKFLKRVGLLPGTLDENWQSSDNYSCLTGNAQMAIIFLKLYKISGDVEYIQAVVKMIEQIKGTQDLYGRNSGIRGAVAGSWPIWGSYTRFAYPNWAAKFFADGLMLKGEIDREMDQKHDRKISA